MTYDIKSSTYSLAQWPALANSNLVSFLNTKSGRNVCSQIFVSLLITRVFGDEVKVFSADDEGAMHLCRNNSAGQDTTTNRNKTGEGAFLV
jgi:hypothetical protein